eukprot:8963327-Prorocentrum_lima.AAC.1
MTSSLVGSEMCIRDRGMVAGVHHGINLLLSLGELTLAPRTKVLNDNQPVSYTHLTLPTICSV